MMVGEGMLQGGAVKVTMKKDVLDFEVKKSARSKKTATLSESKSSVVAKNKISKEKAIV
jgi:hypothetical protein